MCWKALKWISQCAMTIYRFIISHIFLWGNVVQFCAGSDIWKQRFKSKRDPKSLFAVCISEVLGPGSLKEQRNSYSWIFTDIPYSHLLHQNNICCIKEQAKKVQFTHFSKYKSCAESGIYAKDIIHFSLLVPSGWVHKLVPTNSWGWLCWRIG